MHALFSAVLLTGLACCLLSIGVPPAQPPPWGFYGHRKINRHAVFSLPPEMMPFFKKHIDYLTDHAVDADKRRYATRHEAVRHYIDLDVHGQFPFDHLPRNWTDALMRYAGFQLVLEKGDTVDLVHWDTSGSPVRVALHPALTGADTTWIPYGDFREFFIHQVLPQYYDEVWRIPCDSLSRLPDVSGIGMRCHDILVADHLSGHGILPWHLFQQFNRLKTAFMEKDGDLIRRYAADIGHYIGDAHVPLHTTENYNGQLTGQKGIHAFWESRLPELLAEREYDFWVGRATFIRYPKEYFWEMVLESHRLVDSVLTIERELRETFPSDRQMCNETRGQAMVFTQCEEYAAAYNERLGGMVERRMRDAILAVSSIWYSAWVMAGQPDLRLIDEPPAIDTLDTDLDRAFSSGQIKGRHHE